MLYENPFKGEQAFEFSRLRLWSSVQVGSVREGELGALYCTAIIKPKGKKQNLSIIFSYDEEAEQAVEFDLFDEKILFDGKLIRKAQALATAQFKNHLEVKEKNKEIE